MGASITLARSPLYVKRDRRVQKNRQKQTVRWNDPKVCFVWKEVRTSRQTETDGLSKGPTCLLYVKRGSHKQTDRNRWLEERTQESAL